MKLLNLCCGAVRPQGEEWINVDNLHDTILPGTPERENLDKETNYVNSDIASPGGFKSEWVEAFDGILASHCFEHWDCQISSFIMNECRRCLKPGGILLVSVPDASYFRRVHAEDTVENAERLFGEPIHLPDGESTFFGYGLWNRYHRAILTEDALWCYFVRAGFEKIHRVSKEMIDDAKQWEVRGAMARLLNRLPFSLVMAGTKD